MNTKVCKILSLVVAVFLVGCAGQTEQLSMQQPAQGAAPPPPPQAITFPNGTTFGGASGRQASELAQIVVEANNNNLQEYQRLRSGEQQLQGTGEITLFFPVDQVELKQGSLQYTRLITFLDYLSRESRGRRVLFLLIGSASAVGNPQQNIRLSRERSQEPEPIIDQYLVNIPHQFFKVYGLGDIYSPKNVTLSQEQRYQNVRIIAVYQTDQVPVVPQAPRG
jgi:outer membrane protein OmpA-like peptidoglycan-associated protein